jgi:hypothetical protein
MIQPHIYSGGFCQALAFVVDGMVYESYFNIHWNHSSWTFHKFAKFTSTRLRFRLHFVVEKYDFIRWRVFIILGTKFNCHSVCRTTLLSPLGSRVAKSAPLPLAERWPFTALKTRHGLPEQPEMNTPQAWISGVEISMCYPMYSNTLRNYYV